MELITSFLSYINFLWFKSRLLW